MTHLAREQYDVGHGEPIQALRVGAGLSLTSVDPGAYFSHVVGPGISVVRVATAGRAYVWFTDGADVREIIMPSGAVEYFRVVTGETITLSAIELTDASITECN